MKTDIAPVRAGVAWTGGWGACAALGVERATRRGPTSDVRIKSLVFISSKGDAAGHFDHSLLEEIT